MMFITLECHEVVLCMYLIPNEAHESTNQPNGQYPLANQPYLPQNAIINAGTVVTWFNGDVAQGSSIPSTETDTLTAAPMYESGK